MIEEEGLTWSRMGVPAGSWGGGVIVDIYSSLCLCLLAS